MTTHTVQTSREIQYSHTMTDKEKLKKIKDLTEALHEDAASELEELDNREEMLDMEDMEDIRTFEAVVNVTSQIKDILSQ